MVEVIYCADGNKRFADIAIKYGLRYGAQMPRTVHHTPYFVDQNWKDPQRDKYMQALAEHKPALATVLDLEHESQFDEVMAWSDEASRHVSEAVIVIPKVMGIIPRIPQVINGKQIRLGYSVPTSYGGTELPLWEFGKRPVHLLGGSPHRQHELARYLNVVSADGNYIQGEAVKRNQFFANGQAVYAVNKYFPKLNESPFGHVAEDAPYVAFELSIINMITMWTGADVMVRWATEDDLKQVKQIANQYKKELGFVMLPALRKAITKRELYVACYGERVVGFCNWHLRRDGVITVYEIATDKTRKREGIATALLASLPDATIRLKCTQDNNANVFYERVGFQCIAQEDGKKRPLNVWQRGA